MICIYCGAKNDDHAKICARCGTKLFEIDESKEFGLREDALSESGNAVEDLLVGLDADVDTVRLDLSEVIRQEQQTDTTGLKGSAGESAMVTDGRGEHGKKESPEMSVRTDQRDGSAQSGQKKKRSAASRIRKIDVENQTEGAKGRTGAVTMDLSQMHLEQVPLRSDPQEDPLDDPKRRADRSQDLEEPLDPEKKKAEGFQTKWPWLILAVVILLILIAILGLLFL